MMCDAANGRLVIVSGPSGAGKSTVLAGVMQHCNRPLQLSVSATTRAPRPGETDGVDYHFLTHDQFIQRRNDGEFLEWKEVYNRGDFYGTLRETVTAGLNEGKWVVLEIDVEGALMALETYPDAVTIFIHPGGFEELERRLRHRSTEDEETIQRRLEVARREMSYLDRYQYEVINETIPQAIEDICDILNRED